jgi:hypothetical protein
MLVSEVKISASGAPITDATIADGSTVISFPQALDPGEDVLLRRREVAALLRVSHGYLRHMGARLLPVVRIGGAVRYRLSDVLALIEQRTNKAAGGGSSAASQSSARPPESAGTSQCGRSYRVDGADEPGRLARPGGF